jgi:Tfp pilus assembly protein PilE
MRSGRAGFALFEVVLGLVLLGITGSLVLQGVVALTRIVREGRRAGAAAALGLDVLHRIEHEYRSAAPTCAGPGSGARAERGVAAAWSTTDLGSAIDLEVVVARGPGIAGADTVVARVTCR